MKLDKNVTGFWVHWSRLDKRNGYWARGPVSAPFNRRSARHWAIAIFDLWRKGQRV